MHPIGHATCISCGGSPHTQIRNSESAGKEFLYGLTLHQRHSNDHSVLVIPISQSHQLLSSIQ